MSDHAPWRSTIRSKTIDSKFKNLRAIRSESVDVEILVQDSSLTRRNGNLP